MRVAELRARTRQPAQGAAAGVIELDQISEIENRPAAFQTAAHIGPALGQQGHSLGGELTFEPQLNGERFLENKNSQHRTRPLGSRCRKAPSGSTKNKS